MGSLEWDTKERLHFHFPALEKEMATHSSVLAWRIPGTGSLVGCRLWGRTESDTTEATQQQQQQQQQQLYPFTPPFVFEQKQKKQKQKKGFPFGSAGKESERPGFGP